MTVRPELVADHLRALYGADGGDTPGHLVIFTLPGRRTHVFAGDDIAGATPARIAALSASENVYHGVGLVQSPPRAGSRGAVHDVLALPGLWFDLDIAGANHKEDHYPRSRAQALDFLASLPLQPSLINDTGGGLHVYWLFRELAVFGSDAERAAMARLSDGVQRFIITKGTERGWRLDNTADLARILRPAGTINQKNGQLVRPLWRSDVRYAPVDFDAFARERDVVDDVPAVFAQTRDTTPLTSRGETMRALVAAGRAAGITPNDIVNAVDSRVQRYIATVGSRAEGSRDNAAFQIAAFLINDFGLSDDVALAYLREWNANNSPPLPERDLRLKLRSAHRSARRSPGCAHARPRPVLRVSTNPSPQGVA